jgi:two-component system response regulator PilR (NtrC family)
MLTPSPRILVIDDEPDLRTLYELTLLREGYIIEAAGSVAEAQALLRHARFDVLITDMRLPDGLGLELLQAMQNQQRAERCIVMTAYGSAENAVEALKAGAFDYLTKPVDLKQFRAVVASAIRQPRSDFGATPPFNTAPSPVADSADTAETTAPLSVAGQRALDRLVGTSSALCAVKRRVAKVARSMAPILVRGESGTGKELIARAIHACSHRSDGPFVAVNCGAIPENLLEAEFFGAKKGSYTGASHDREGYFQAARNGTLFLDEIGDLPLVMQTKLLRAIQERRIRSLGSTQEEPVDVRIVSATHKDLAAEVQVGHFRQDLYYRLNVIEIVSPPLRERREDLPALCTALLTRIAQEAGTTAPTLAPEALDQLLHHPLEGNVRELENLLHRALALSEGNTLRFDDLDIPAAPSAASMSVSPPPAPSPVVAPMPPTLPAAQAAQATPCTAISPLPDPPYDLQAWLDQQERAMLIRALQSTDFNRTAAAAQLGLNLRQIRYRISRLAIVVPNSGAEPDEHA